MSSLTGQGGKHKKSWLKFYSSSARASGLWDHKDRAPGLERDGRAAALEQQEPLAEAPLQENRREEETPAESGSVSLPGWLQCHCQGGSSVTAGVAPGAPSPALCDQGPKAGVSAAPCDTCGCCSAWLSHPDTPGQVWDRDALGAGGCWQQAAKPGALIS